MISMMTTTKMTDRSVIATCPLGISVRGTGLPVSPALLPVMPPMSVRSERPIQAPAVAAAKAQAPAYAFAAAATGAGAGTATGAQAANGQHEQQKTQHGKWAFRGLEPWSDPA